MDEHKYRQQWFEAYAERIEQGIVKPPEPGIRHPCPCCGYPTLSEQGAYEICSLCTWEDDGQDDPHADEVWGGPNKDYSLSEARVNFQKHLIMHREEEKHHFQQNSRKLDLKRQLIKLYEELLSNPAKLPRIIEQIEELESRLTTTAQRTPLP